MNIMLPVFFLSGSAQAIVQESTHYHLKALVTELNGFIRDSPARATGSTGGNTPVTP
jgi:hypothetical protein